MLETALRDILSPAARKVVYQVYTVAALIVGAFSIGYSGIGEVVPTAVVVATNVIAYLAIPVGALAVTNTVKPEEAVEAPVEASQAPVEDAPSTEAYTNPGETYEAPEGSTGYPDYR